MGLTKDGKIIYRSKTSKCQKCAYFIKDPYQCWMHNYISFRIWENCIGYECEYFKSTILKNHNNCYIHRDYENDELFPNIPFGGIFRFSPDGKIIGKINE